MLKREATRKVAGQTTGTVDACELSLMMPTVFDYLTQTKYADGSPRATSSLLLFNDGGVLKAMLKDADAKLCCWVASNSLAGLFATLEAALNDPSHEWRQDRSAVGDQAKRVNRRTA